MLWGYFLKILYGNSAWKPTLLKYIRVNVILKNWNVFIHLFVTPQSVIIFWMLGSNGSFLAFSSEQSRYGAGPHGAYHSVGNTDTRQILFKYSRNLWWTNELKNIGIEGDPKKGEASWFFPNPPTPPEPSTTWAVINIKRYHRQNRLLWFFLKLNYFS